MRGLGGVAIRGDDLPRDVAPIPVRPVWQLTDAEERRTRQVEADYEPGAAGRAVAPRGVTRPRRPDAARRAAAEGLSRLLDRSGASVLGLWLIALSLGAAHAIQPGHGKSLVAAASVGERGGWMRGVVLALAITAAHIGGVLAVAWPSGRPGRSRYPDINREPGARRPAS